MNQDTQQKRRSRRTPGQWAGIVEQWRGSGQRAEDYAKQHDLGVDNLWRWSARFGKSGKPSCLVGKEERRPGGSRPGPKFVAVQVAPRRAMDAQKREAGGRQDIEIAWPGGPIVRLSGEVSRERLAAVMQALAEVAPC